MVSNEKVTSVASMQETTNADGSAATPFVSSVSLTSSTGGTVSITLTVNGILSSSQTYMTVFSPTGRRGTISGFSGVGVGSPSSGSGKSIAVS